MNNTALRSSARIETKAAPGNDEPTIEQISESLETFMREAADERKKHADELKAERARIDLIEKKANRPMAPGDTRQEPNYDAERKALATFARTGDDQEMKTLSVGSDPDGGYLVHAALSSGMTKRIFDQSPMRRIARVETIKLGDAWEEPLDLNDVGATWTGEAETRAETSTAQVGVLKVPVEELYALQRLTQRLIDDSGTDIGAWVEGKIADRFARAEGAAFITGDGIKKPRGFLTHPNSPNGDLARPFGTLQTVASGLQTGPTADALRALTWTLRAPYRNGAVWLMSSATASYIDMMTTATGDYLWRDKMTAGSTATLLGYPVEIDETMPNVAAGALPIAFGNFKIGYTIVDKAGIRWLRDPYTQKGFVLMYAYRRVGGEVANSDAIKLMKISIDP